MKCPQCGLVNWVTAEACKRCGLDFTGADHTEEAAPSDDYQSPYGATDSYQSPYSTAGAYHGYGNHYPNPSVHKSSGLAIASLVLGVISFLTLGLLGAGAIIALVMGIVAVRRARRQPAHYGGEGFAIAGIVLGSVSILMFGYLALIMAIAVPNLLASRRAANEAGVIRNLRTIASAQATYYAMSGNKQFGTLQQLVDKDLIEPSLARGTKYGYRFEIRVGYDSFEALATPLNYGQTSSPGTRSFYVSSDSGYVILGADKKGLEANIKDPPIGTEPTYNRANRRTATNPYYEQDF